MKGIDMLGLFQTKEEKELGLRDFLKWCQKIEACGFNFVKRNAVSRQQLMDYQSLVTPEQRLYAAYTSLDPSLKDMVRLELSQLEPNHRGHILKLIYNALEQKGKHGCSHLLKKDFKNDF